MRCVAMDPRQLVRYNHSQRRAFAEFFVKELDWDTLTEDHETSHHTIANVFMHGCNMEDWYLHSIWPSKPWTGPKYDGFSSAADMLARVLQVEAKTKAALAHVGAKELAEVRQVQVSNTQTAKVTLDQILTEMVVEDMHHRGEILAMLWRNDIEPPYESFLDWSAAHRK